MGRRDRRGRGAGHLAGLQDEYREERYRPAPALVRAARAGTPLNAARVGVMTAPLRCAALLAARRAACRARGTRPPRCPSCRWRFRATPRPRRCRPPARPGSSAPARAPRAACWRAGSAPAAPARPVPAATSWRAGGRARSRPRCGAAACSSTPQPNTLARPLQAVPNDPLSVPPDDWRAKVVDPALVPPPVTPTSPLIALIDAQLDATHPEFAGSNTSALAAVPDHDLPRHGHRLGGGRAGQRRRDRRRLAERARAQRAAAGRDHVRGARPTAIATAIEQGAAVINMSYGSTGLCLPEYVALQFAVARRIVPVAAAGNEFAEGNPLEFPASLPHVLTIAALAPDGNTARCSRTRTRAVDLSAPGRRHRDRRPARARRRRRRTATSARAEPASRRRWWPRRSRGSAPSGRR